MSSVRDVVFELLRQHGLTTIFGNPGSNELVFLQGMPSDFRYILGLHEGVVTGMADGYAMATGRPVLLNLHAAAGSGNAMGALTNARNSHSPLVITAGQQVRAQIGVEALLANAGAAELPRPLAKWSAEPATAEDTPRTIAEAIHTAATMPSGPVYVSIPYDDWMKPAPRAAAHLMAREVHSARTPSNAQLALIAERIAAAEAPALVAGPDVDAADAGGRLVALAERIAAPVWIAPSASRCPFPTGHRLFQGVLPASIRGVSERLAGHDLIVVVGAPVFRYHQFDPGELLPAGARLLQLTVDPAEAARAPMGTSIVAGIAETLDGVLDLVPASGRPAPPARSRPAPVLTGPAPLPPATVFDVVNAVKRADDVIVKESTSTTGIFWDHVDIVRQGGYYFPSAGGLGFGLPAAIGVQLADPARRVIALIGDGSANYALPALWTAVRYRVPVVVVVLRNGEYAALRAFAREMTVANAPGIELPGIDFCALARGYGMRAHSAGSAEELAELLRAGLAAEEPTLIDVATTVVDPFG
ncbi:MAG: benzoylformate decarboxylase [Microbacteriaceae bacterium]